MEWKTLHLAHFRSRPQHYAAIRCYSPSDVAAVAEDNEFTFDDYSPELAVRARARVRDECDELATTMCTSQFRQSKHMPAQVYDQVMESVRAKLNASVLDPGDSAMIGMKVQDTLETTLKYLQIGHKMDMLVMYTITHTVINRSHEE